MVYNVNRSLTLSVSILFLPHASISFASCAPSLLHERMAASVGETPNFVAISKAFHIASVEISVRTFSEYNRVNNF